MLAGAAAIGLLVTAFVLFAFTRWRTRLALPPAVWLVGGGLLFPSAALLALLAYGVAVGEALLPHQSSAQATRIMATARQWEWTFHYPEHGGLALAGTLLLPVGAPVDVHVTSEDVIHAFWIPRFAGKIDALPGRVTVIRIEAAQPGSFEARCAEFCGLGHAAMSFTAEAVPAPDYESRLRSAAARP